MASSRPPRSAQSKSKEKRTSSSQLNAKTILGTEVDRESADSRRVAMLKCQMIQLERQLLLLTDIAGQRKEILLHTSDSLDKLIEICRKGIGQPGQTADVAMKRSDLIMLVEKARDLQGSLVAQHDNTLNDRTPETAITPYNKFLTELEVSSKQSTAPKRGPSQSLAATIKTFSMLNLSEVSLLEQHLVELRGKLVSISNFLTIAFTKSWMPPDFSSHYSDLLQETTRDLDQCSSELLELSLLVPVYPTTIQSKPITRSEPSAISDLEYRRIVSEIKSENIRWTIETKSKQLEQESALLKAEIVALRRELEFHSKIYDKQTTYCESLMRGMRKGYALLHDSVRSGFVDSLTPVLSAYTRMEKYPTESGLREFLDQCRTWLPVVKDAVDNLEGQLNAESVQEEQIFKEFNQILVDNVKKIKANDASSGVQF